jgi:hypothetical protein
VAWITTFGGRAGSAPPKAPTRPTTLDNDAARARIRRGGVGQAISMSTLLQNARMVVILASSSNVITSIGARV